ncbi:MAG: S8 family serine peptidase [Verrucomicrobia bacterium]|nr:S8 family serine peptidase [Verrucomicrobiota bacterium]
MLGKHTPQTAVSHLALAVNVVIITAALLSCGKTPVRAATDEDLNRFDEEDSYVADGQTIQVQRVPDEMVVNFASTESPLDAASGWSRASGHSLETVRTVPGRGVLCRVPAGAGQNAVTATLTALKSDATVRYAYPVYRTPANGKRMFLSDQVIVRLAENVDLDQLPLLTQLGLIHRDTLWAAKNIHMFSSAEPQARNPFKVCGVLRARPEVVWAEPNFGGEMEWHATTPNDSLFSHQWHHNNTGTSPQTPSRSDADIDSENAWDNGYGSVGIRIAIVDDGVQTNHPDLQANIIQGYDFYYTEVDPSDSDPNPAHANDNHGTAVAGAAAAVANNSTGVAGVAGKCKLLPIRIAENGASASDIIFRALIYAADNADVINCSWSFPTSSTVTSAFQYAYDYGRGNKGCVVLCSSGNSASGNGQFSYDHLEEYAIHDEYGDGDFFLEFTYMKDGTTDAGEDAVWLAEVYLPLSGGSGYFPYTFDTAGQLDDWTFDFGGDANWTHGVDAEHSHGTSQEAVRSGDIGPNQESRLYSPLVSISASKPSIWFRRWMSSQSLDVLELRLLDPDTLEELDSKSFSGGQPASRTTAVAYPASLSTVLAVGGSTDFDYRSDYSQYGSVLDLVAPTTGGFSSPTTLFAGAGYVTGVATTDRTGSGGYDDNGDYTYFSGTSCSAPVVAGVAALVLSRDGNLSRSTLKNKLIENCTQIGPLSYPGSPGRNDYYGHGRVNANGSVGATTADTTAPSFSSAKAIHYRAVDVTFSEPMGEGVLDPSKYEITAGAGTLSTNPSKVIRMTPSSYRLLWTSGDLATSGTVTIKVLSGVKDVAGNSVAANSTQNTTGTKRIVAINCGNVRDSEGFGAQYLPPYDPDSGFQGNEFVADYLDSSTASYYATVTIDTSLVTDPAPTTVYNSVRRSYQSTATIKHVLPSIPSGSKNVRLHFCPLYITSAGDMVFDIKINGTTVYSSFDMYQPGVTQLKAHTKTFTNISPNGNSQIIVELVPLSAPDTGQYHASICGIDVAKP